ncbi:MAG: DNA repair protein RecN [Gammaproteobacteria bacterium]|nr:DNA repair protein RecN [Gammaproteobacteria bacterium]
MALREITIHNFAIIKQLEIEIEDGLTVVTGESGTGKSIVLGALNLLLGARAETNMIRHGEEQCEISALFEVSRLDNVNNWLEQRDLRIDTEEEQDTHCLIRRIVRASKPTKCYINDQPTTLASLKELGLMLVDIHGQHDHQSLLRKPTQRQIIDQFAGHNSKLNRMAKLAAKIHRLDRELQSIYAGNSDNADRLELLSFQLNELDEANITEQEFTELAQEQSRLSNAEELINGIKLAIDGLYHNDSNNVSSDLGNQINNLTRLAEFDASLLKPVELLNSALAQIEEAQAGFDSSLAIVEQDPERLSEIDQRLDTLITLARKHRCADHELVDRHHALRAEYKRLENQHAKPEKLEQELKALTVRYTKVANAVSAKRQQVAEKLSQEISNQMQDLGMKGGALRIEVEPQIDDAEIISENGIDNINFMVRTNHGMPFKPLHKTASGGELSRISLAIQVITSQQSHTPSLVFDEVDVGVGGKVAGIVGEKLRNLGKHAQVLCITHLPQVASRGHHHLAVDKVSTIDETYSTLVQLEGEMRTEEIARMLGGKEITDRTRAHAQEMLGDSKDALKAAS